MQQVPEGLPEIGTEHDVLMLKGEPDVRIPQPQDERKGNIDQTNYDEIQQESNIKLQVAYYIILDFPAGYFIFLRLKVFLPMVYA